jgi:hypothetical protein
MDATLKPLTESLLAHAIRYTRPVGGATCIKGGRVFRVCSRYAFKVADCAHMIAIGPARVRAAFFAAGAVTATEGALGVTITLRGARTLAGPVGFPDVTSACGVTVAGRASAVTVLTVRRRQRPILSYKKTDQSLRRDYSQFSNWFSHVVLFLSKTSC